MEELEAAEMLGINLVRGRLVRAAVAVRAGLARLHVKNVALVLCLW